MNDHKIRIVTDALSYSPNEPWAESVLRRLEAAGVTFPLPPKPVIEVSDAAYRAYEREWQSFSAVNGLRAAFKVMLREALAKWLGEKDRPVYSSRNSVYEDLTGEEWPT